MNGVRVSLHPAGHVLGSAQVRIEYRGEVWVVSGDYHVEADATCAAFEPVRCDTFITESTFGLPVYRWRPQVRALRGDRRVVAREPGGGKSERPVRVCLGQGAAPARRRRCEHRADRLPRRGRAAQRSLPRERRAAAAHAARSRRSKRASTGAARSSSRRRRRRERRGCGASAITPTGSPRGGCRSAARAVAARWTAVSSCPITPTGPDCCAAIEATGAPRVFVTHGSVPVMVRWLTEQGFDARAFETRLDGEQDGSASAVGRDEESVS